MEKSKVQPDPFQGELRDAYSKWSDSFFFQAQLPRMSREYRRLDSDQIRQESAEEYKRINEQVERDLNNMIDLIVTKLMEEGTITIFVLQEILDAVNEKHNLGEIEYDYILEQVEKKLRKKLEEKGIRFEEKMPATVRDSFLQRITKLLPWVAAEKRAREKENRIMEMMSKAVK